MRRTVKITWHGHSCFTIDNGTRILALDPYDAAMIGYPPLKIQAHAMLASHQHGDHNCRSAVQFLPAEGTVIHRAEMVTDLAARQDPASFIYESIETFHDEIGGRKRGRNTVHAIMANGLRIVHLGDLGHILTPGQAAAIGRPDLLLIPVGGFFTIDAAAARTVINQLQPACIAPMHYQIGFGDLPLADVETFIQTIADEWQIRRLPGPSLDFDAECSGCCWIFQYASGS